VREPVWIDEREALALHGRLLALEGGAAGLRDKGLLESALKKAPTLCRRRKGRGTRKIESKAMRLDIAQMAAAYTACIVLDHPFIDGNKRTGFVAGVLFLELNGYRFVASEEDTARAVLSLAAGTMEVAAFAAWMRANLKRR
jgi:death on curing protein